MSERGLVNGPNDVGTPCLPRELHYRTKEQQLGVVPSCARNTRTQASTTECGSPPTATDRTTPRGRYGVLRQRYLDRLGQLGRLLLGDGFGPRIRVDLPVIMRGDPLTHRLEGIQIPRYRGEHRPTGRLVDRR